MGGGSDGALQSFRPVSMWTRRGRPGANSSLLAVKIFDETGDRPTPTHSKTRCGKRLRYYVSGRLIRKSGQAELSGWRLPAPKLESAVVDLVQAKLNDPGFLAKLLPEADAGLISDVSSKLVDIRDIEAIAAIVDRIDIAPGALTVAICVARLGHTLINE